jgi:anti-sigma B factor antagonist
MGATEQLQVEQREESDRVVLRLEGELDMASAPLLRSAVEHANVEGRQMLVLDCEKLRFIDSTGLRVVLWASELCRERGLDFALTPGSAQVQRLLSISGAGDHLRVIASPDDLLV